MPENQPYEGQHEGDPALEPMQEPVIGDAPPKAHTLFSNKAYDRLKWVAIVLLPALALLYLALAPVWGLPKQEEVAATIVAVDLFLGTVLGLSSKQYKNSDARFDGVIDVKETPEGLKQASLILRNYENPADVVNQKEVTFKVLPPGKDA